MLQKHIRQMVWAAADGRQRDMLALPLEYLAGWLFGLTLGKTSPELAEKITRYRENCFIALWGALQRGELTRDIQLRDQPTRRGNSLLIESREAYQTNEEMVVLVLRSSKAITKEPMQMAPCFRWSPPDPRFRPMIELLCCDLHRAFNLISIGKTLASEGITAEETPPSLLEVEPARPFGNEDVLDAWMVR